MRPRMNKNDAIYLHYRREIESFIINMNVKRVYYGNFVKAE